MKKVRKKSFYPLMMIYFCMVVVIISSSICLTACGKKEKIKYGDKPGVAQGKIKFSDGMIDIDIENIKASVNSQIDYTSEIKYEEIDENNYSLDVNASAVKPEKPGNYEVMYNLEYQGNTYTKVINVTIVDENGETMEKVTDKSGEVKDTDSINEESRDNTGDSEKQKQQNLPNAVIELLSGDSVTIKCTIDRFIVSTRTEEKEVVRNGKKYHVSNLIIEFNTGEEQTLETVEKRID